MSEEDQEKIDAIYRALMEESPTGDPPLIMRIGEVCEAYERGRWAARVIFFGLPALAAVGAAVQAVMSWRGHG